MSPVKLHWLRELKNGARSFSVYPLPMVMIKFFFIFLFLLWGNDRVSEDLVLYLINTLAERLMCSPYCKDIDVEEVSGT